VTAYYNEIDHAAANVLRALISAHMIPHGEVDERSIRDVAPADLDGFTQCHFFAGIGGWPLALRQAGWPDDRPVWTGSCPCQPFSSAGRQKGFDDERHLWPVWFDLIKECRPDIVFGEQVGGKSGEAWLDLVWSDLENEGFAVGALEAPAASVGAPHIRQRQYFAAERVGNALGAGLERQSGDGHAGRGRASPAGSVATSGGACRVGDADGAGREPRQDTSAPAGHRHPSLPDGPVGGLPGRGPVNGFWLGGDWLCCRDGRWRVVEAGTFPLANGIPSRVGALRGYGNAIVIPQAAAFIEDMMEWLKNDNDNQQTSCIDIHRHAKMA